MSCICRRGPSLTDLRDSSQLTSHTYGTHSQWFHLERPPLFVLARACTCARACVHSFRFRKLIYYCSHSAPPRARLSIWAVVPAVCSNLLLFNCLTTARPTANPARKKKNAGHLLVKKTDKMQLTLKQRAAPWKEQCIPDRDGLWQREVQFRLMYNTCQYFYHLEFKWFANTTNKTASKCKHSPFSCCSIRERLFFFFLLYPVPILLSVILPEMLINALVRDNTFGFVF